MAEANAKKQVLQQQRELQHLRFLEEVKERHEFQAAKDEALSKLSSNPGPTESRKRKRKKRHHGSQIQTSNTRVKKVIAVLSDSESEDFNCGVPMFKGSKQLDEEFEKVVSKADCHFPHSIAIQSSDDEPPEEVSSLSMTDRQEVEEHFNVATPSKVPAKEDEGTSSTEEGEGRPTNRKALQAVMKQALTDIPVPSCVAFKPRRRGEKRPPTLLEKLLAQEINEERVELLQCVKYIVGNNFFGIGQQ